MSSLAERFRAKAHALRVDIHAAWLAARDPRVPLPSRMVGWAVAAYAFSPIDLIPDFVPVLGLLDDAILLPLGLWLFLKLVPAELLAEHRATAEATSHRPVSRAGAALIIATWIVVALAIAAYVWAWRYW